jgi:hypothetical protein
MGNSNEFNKDVMEWVKAKHGIDCSIVELDTSAGLKWLSLVEYGYLGSVLLIRSHDEWRATVLPFGVASKEFAASLTP